MATLTSVYSTATTVDAVAMATSHPDLENYENHPIVQKFQDSLRKHLLKHRERLTFDLREAAKDLKVKNKEREDVGSRLYEIQRDVEKQKKVADSLEVQYRAFAERRPQLEQQLEQTKNSFDVVLEAYRFAVNEEQAVIQKIWALNMQLYHLTLVKNNIQSDVVALRQSTKKVSSDRWQLEANKQKQDVLVNRLMLNVRNLEERLGLYESQIVSMKGEMKVLCDATSKAKMESEAMDIEGRHLLEKWNESLRKVKNWDETLLTLQEAFTLQQESVKVSEKEIKSVDKLLNAEVDTFGKLSSICDRLEYDVASTSGQMIHYISKHETLRLERITLKCSCEDVQHSLTLEKNEKLRKKSELVEVEKQIQSMLIEKRQIQKSLNDQILNQRCVDKSSQNIQKEIQEIQEKINNLENQKTKSQTDLNGIELELTEKQEYIYVFQRDLVNLRKNFNSKEEEFKEKEQRQKQILVLINKRQEHINKLLYKMDQFVDKTGGGDFSPLEIQINSIQQELEEKMSLANKLQNDWLKQQTALMKLSEVKDGVVTNLRHLERQLSVYTRHKLQQEEEIERVEKICRTLKRNIDNLHNSFTKLNRKAYNEHVQEENLQNITLLTEEKLFSSFADGERELIILNDQVEKIREDEECLSKELLSSENELLLWQQKFQLSKEMKSTADTEYKNGGEVHVLQENLHRMKVQFTDLRKQQGQIAQGMEHAVRCWDNLLTKGELKMMAANTGAVKKEGSAQLRTEATKRKVRLITKELGLLERNVNDLIRQQDELSKRTVVTRLNNERTEMSIRELNKTLSDKIRERIKNLEILVMKQKQAKYFQSVSECKYKLFCKKGLDAIETETKKQIGISEQLRLIVEEISKEFPELISVLDKIQIKFAAQKEYLISH